MGESLLSGPVAQLGARFHGMEEVIGSIPIRSTNFPSHLNDAYGELSTDRFGRTTRTRICVSRAEHVCFCHTHRALSVTLRLIRVTCRYAGVLRQKS